MKNTLLTYLQINENKYLYSTLHKYNNTIFGKLAFNLILVPYDSVAEYIFNICYNTTHSCKFYKGQDALLGKHFKDINPCAICGGHIPFNDREFKYSETCSMRCQNKLWTPRLLERNPNHFKNIAIKSLATKRANIIDGKDSCQRGAESAAFTKTGSHKHQTKHNYSIRREKARLNEENILRNINRIQNIIKQIGVVRFSKLYILTKYRNRKPIHYSVRHSLQLILGNYYDEFINNYEFGLYQFIDVEINKEIFLKTCIKCGDLYCKRDTHGKYKQSSSMTTCSRSCAVKGRTVLLRTRRAISIAGKKAWSNMSKEKRRDRHQKLLNTMENDIVNGKNGFKRRSEKLLKTKMKNGFIKQIGHKYVDPDYREYVNLVTRLTRRQDLNIIKNINKREKTKFDLDHIFPISKGYEYGIPAELIADIENLQIIDSKINISKSNKLITFTPKIDKYIEDMLNEFENSQIRL
jgi:hypothetical protein